MKKHDVKFSDDKFKSFVRYMIHVAEQKRCVPYYEIENIYGLSHEQVGYYSGILGLYCIEEGFPLLNGLIISSTECKPSEGFDDFQKSTKMDWGQVVQMCWKRFHVTSSRQKQTENYSGLDGDIEEFLKDLE